MFFISPAVGSALLEVNSWLRSESGNNNSDGLIMVNKLSTNLSRQIGCCMALLFVHVSPPMLLHRGLGERLRCPKFTFSEVLLVRIRHFDTACIVSRSCSGSCGGWLITINQPSDPSSMRRRWSSESEYIGLYSCAALFMFFVRKMID